MSGTRDWRNLAYLLRGSTVQKEVYDLLLQLDIMNVLAEYEPMLVGTVPLGLQVESSDLDIICEVYDQEKYTATVRRYFGKMDDFCIVTRMVNGMPRCKINFRAGRWPIELFAQPLGTGQQNGCLHMIVEAHILDLLGNEFREHIIDLKSGGMKTEPAFAHVLSLNGDPYEALLALGELELEALDSLCKKSYLNT
ncbi:DUF4269 domain-containing protein [Paenibacillus monticola]|uniref:DUF4269 domain-containing protein n=1 Tax=Paenibacillus monticola TaxID=2666075 RepID=A0A7X2H8D0_9BACL|nr:DUF4269 domain-containing protein [Paenibacillus monticola]MRN55396.1 DUF4269 domain-containing protein [Paenibacillus monticola]